MLSGMNIEYGQLVRKCSLSKKDKNVQRRREKIFFEGQEELYFNKGHCNVTEERYSYKTLQRLRSIYKHLAV